MKRFFGAPTQAHINVELLSAFLDGQVSQAERALIESHLRGCSLCREELESLRWTVSMVQALPRVRVPHAFTLSEAMVGARKPATGASWLGGLARGLGAVAAVALVVVLAATLLRPPMAVPMPSSARFAPTALPTEGAAELFMAPAAVPEAVSEAQGERAAAAAAEADQGTAEAPAEIAIAAATAPPTEQPQLTAPPAPPTEPAPAARAVAPPATPEPPLVAMAPPGPAETPTADAKTFGLGGGAAAAALPAGSLTPEPLPPLAAIADVWPATARLVYTDWQALWAVDRVEGLRQLVVAQTANTPLLAPDGQYVVYRTVEDDRAMLWGMPWHDGKPRLLLDEAQLPKEKLAPQHTARRIQDISWVPGQRTLALTLVAVPAPEAPDALPKTELWTLEVETGALRYVADMGRAYWPFYAPDGQRFALLAYGTEDDPQGQLILINADGSNPRVALTFPAGPAKLSYETQVAWLPDSSGLWLAIPTADLPEPGALNGTRLYLILASGQSQEVALLDAYQVAWSPDSTQLAYLRFTDDQTGEGELHLADADGSYDELYAAVQNPAFLGWSPAGTYFLYQDNDQIYLGAAGRAPVGLGSAISLFDPRWVSDREFVSLHETGGGRLLTLHTVEGKAYELLPLPGEVMLDVVHQ